MASGPEHYQEAERLLRFAKTYDKDSDREAAICRQDAAVHATLALAAATAMAAGIRNHIDHDDWDSATVMGD